MNAPRHAWLALVLATGACSAEKGPVEPPPSAAPPDILVIVADTVRADRLGCYGYARDTSPHLDRLAAQGALFEDVTSSGSWTWPSHASLFTGEPPWRHGAHFTSPEQAAFHSDEARMSMAAMDPSLPTLAEQLGEQGYHSVVLSSNSYLQPALGLVRGFSEARYIDGESIVDKDRATTAAALERIGTPRDEPLLLFVNLLSAHAPYVMTPSPWLEQADAVLRGEPQPPWLTMLRNEGQPGLNIYNTQRSSGHRIRDLFAAGAVQLPPEGLGLLSDLYDGNVRLVDHLVGKLLEAWQASHPNGVIVVVSDHGEFLGEHSLLDHGRAVYSQVTQVPLVLVAPGVAPGARVAEAVQLEELHPTLLELASGEPRPGSLLRRLEGEPREGPILAAAWPDPHAAEAGAAVYQQGWRLYREGSWALITDADGEQPALYDLSVDPGMERDQGEAWPERLATLRQHAAGAFPEAERAPEPAQELPEEVRRSLEALGYLEQAP
jgi:arylsulfatase A-like enzyme